MIISCKTIGYFWWKVANQILIGKLSRVKLRKGLKQIDSLGYMSPIRGAPLPLECPQTKCKKYSACPEKPFLLNPFLVLSPCSKEILKKENLYSKGVEGGGGGKTYGTCPLKTRVFFGALPK